MSSITPTIWTGTVSLAYNEESHTRAFRDGHLTREAALQALWRLLLVEHGSIYDSVIEFWVSLFHVEDYPRNILKVEDVYNVSNDEYKLIRKLITPEMYDCIQEMMDSPDGENVKNGRLSEEQKALDAEFLEHFCSVQMTEEEIVEFIFNYSYYSGKFGSGPQPVSWAIWDVKIVQ